MSKKINFDPVTIQVNSSVEKGLSNEISGHGKMVRGIPGAFVKGQDPGGERPDISSVKDPVDVPAVGLAGESVKGAGGICFKHLLEPVGLKGFESG